MKPPSPSTTLRSATPHSGSAIETLHEAVMAGESGRSRVTAAAETAWAIRDRYADAFPLPQDRIAAILEDLGDRLGEIYQAEVAALELTARAIGR